MSDEAMLERFRLENVMLRKRVEELEAKLKDKETIFVTNDTNEDKPSTEGGL